MAALAMNITTTVTITAMTCPVCGVHYGLDEEQRQRAKEAGHHKYEWYCTSGHKLGYHGESEAEGRLAKQLKDAHARIESEERWGTHLSGLLDTERKTHASTKGQLTKTRKRIQGGVCPCCNRHFTNVERHMASQHPADVNGFLPGASV